MRLCPGVPYVLKTDDDMYINLLTLSTLVARHAAEAEAASARGDSNKASSRDLLVGSLICGAVPIRDGQNKWYSPQYMFGEKVYPNYLSGTGYAMSRGAAERLLDASDRAPLFHLEDVYVTGILAREARLRPRDHPGFREGFQTGTMCLPPIVNLPLTYMYRTRFRSFFSMYSYL